MSDDPAGTAPADLREQLAAFLAGELDGPAADALQDRIDAEPWVGRLADEVADLLVALGRVDEVAPPEGYGGRLRAGLAARLEDVEAADLAPPADRALAASGAAALTGWAPERGRAAARRPGPPRWLAAAAVLAVVGALAVGTLVSSDLLRGGSDTADEAVLADGGDAGGEAATAGQARDEDAAREVAGVDATQEAADEAPALEAEAEELQAADDAALSAPAPAAEATESAGGADAAGTAAGAPAAGPAVLDLGAVAEADLRPLVADDPAATGLLGTDAARARELAAAYRDELLRAPDRPDGTSAGACVEAVLAQAGGDLVPAVVAVAELDGRPVLVHALVRSADGTTLDRVDVWVVDPADCATVQVLPG